jgi:hypothetical protein
MNDDSAPTMEVSVAFGGGGGLKNGLTGPSEPGDEPVVSLVVGAVVITLPGAPVKNSQVATLSEEQKDHLADDAIQSAAYLTIVDVPNSDDSISFLIPPATSGNWQLIGVGSRNHIDTLQDFDDKKDSAIWYGFTDDFQNNIVKPGDSTTLDLVAGCALDKPPVGPCTAKP